MKRVLIIVYYWPPFGGSGVQRWVKFVKHLRSFGWEPIIYTPENPYIHERDESLLKDIPEGVEVLKQSVFEVQKFFGAASTSNSNTAKPSFFFRLKKFVGNAIRGNFFIPDARVGWIKPSVEFLSDYLLKNKMDVVVSSGPPHSMHLIAQQLSKKFKLPWLADFRDPWLEILDFHGFKVGPQARKKHENMFVQVLTDADSIIVAHPTVKAEFEKNINQKISVITNGYDTEDFSSTKSGVIDRNDDKFRIVFVGILYDFLNSTALWQGIKERVDNDQEFRKKLELIFVGKIHSAAMKDLEENSLLPYSTFTGYVAHDMAVEYEKSADLLLLLTPANQDFKYVIPGKLFEYLATGKPILCLALPDNDSAVILKEANAGRIVHPNDRLGVVSALKNIGQISPNREHIATFERKQLTAMLVEELDRIYEGKSH